MAATTATLGTMAAVGSAAASASATAAAVGGIGAMLTSTMGILSLASTGVGLVTSLAASNSQKGIARQAAYDETLAAKAGRLRGEQEQNKIKKTLLRDLSAATARSGQAGGGPMLLNQQAQGIESDAADAQNVSSYNTYMESRQRRAQAAVYRRSGRTSILDYVGAAGEAGGRIATYAAAR